MVEVIERGDITFFIRPRVQPSDAPGIQRFFVVLGAGLHHRRLRIGRKRLPDRPGQRFWAQIERVGTLDHVIGDQLEGETYMTQTRGERYQPPARPVAQGEYALVRHDDHSHLVYRVDPAGEQDELAREAAVGEHGSFVLLFKRRGGRATWTTDGDPPGELDVEDAEVVLVGADEDDAAVTAAFAQPSAAITADGDWPAQ